VLIYYIDFPTDRKQRVRLGNTLSDIITLNTGSPQDCVLSAPFKIIYTNLLKFSHGTIIILKYGDDTVIKSSLNHK